MKTYIIDYKITGQTMPHVEAIKAGDRQEAKNDFIRLKRLQGVSIEIISITKK